MNNKFWVVNDQYDKQIYSELMQSGRGSLTAKIIASRKELDQGQLESFLNPKLEDLLDPLLFKDMEKTVTKILETGFKGKNI